MLKTHLKTNLKYLCKTIKDDPTYKGSGKHWRNHLNIHGRDVSSELLFSSNNITEFSQVCLEYSKTLDVVDSNEFANLIPENGLDGGDTYSNQTPERKVEIGNKLSESLTKYNMSRPKEHNDAIAKARSGMSHEAKNSRCKKIQDVYATRKHDHLFERYSKERLGSNNPAAQAVTINNKTYKTIAEAMEATDTTRSSITSRLNSTSEKWKDWLRVS